MIKSAISKVIQGEHLSFAESSLVMEQIMDGRATDAQIGSFLTALRMKGETAEEIAGCSQVMIDKSQQIAVKNKALVDTCGTGGDGSGTFNISTTVALVVAGAGLAVAKHGNRSVSSKSGSADVLENLGVKINLTPTEVAQSIEEIDIGFLFAPIFHKSMKHALEPRKQIGIRSIFNILGPLTNPARAKHQVVGVYDQNLTELVAEVLKKLGVESAYVVHGAGGLDEFSTLGTNKVTELREGKLRSFELDPREFNLPIASLEELKGGSPIENAEIIRKVLAGEKGAARDIVVLNAGAAIAIAGQAKSIAEGIKLAEETIDFGKAYAKLEQLIQFSNSCLGVVL